MEEAFEDVLAARELILARLRQSQEEFKEMTHHPKSITKHLPMQDKYSLVTFSDDEYRSIINSMLDDNFNQVDFEYQMSQKLIVANVAFEQQEEAKVNADMELRRSLKDHEKQIRDVYEALELADNKLHHNHQYDENPMHPKPRKMAEYEDPFERFQDVSLHERTAYQKWTGNATIPKRWRYLLPETNTIPTSDLGLTIPFKPAAWQQRQLDFDVQTGTSSSAGKTPQRSALRNHNNSTTNGNNNNGAVDQSMSSQQSAFSANTSNTANNPVRRQVRIQSTNAMNTSMYSANTSNTNNNANNGNSKLNADASTLAATTVSEVFDHNQYWYQLDVSDFLRALTWCVHFNKRQLAQLEGSLLQQTFSDKQLIVNIHEPLSFCVIRYGEVYVMERDEEKRGYVQIRTLYSGECFGYAFTEPNSDDASNHDSDHHGHQTENGGNNLSKYAYFANGEVTLLSCGCSVLNDIMQDSVGGTGSPEENGDAAVALSAYTQAYCKLGLTLSEDALNLRLDTTVDKALFIDGLRHFHRVLDQPYISPELRYRLRVSIIPLFSPTISLRDTVDVFISRMKAIFPTDRFALYLLDKTNGFMQLFTSSLDPHSNSIATATPTGIRMPLKGIAAYVAQHNVVLNIKDCYTSVLFDSAMDIRTGYRSSQMLCVPVCDALQQVVGVLQWINPVPSRTFTLYEEELATIIAKLGAKQITEMQRQITSSSTGVNGAGTVSMQCYVGRYESLLDNRHMQYKLRIVDGGMDLVPARTSNLFAVVQNHNPTPKSRGYAGVSSAGEFLYADINEHIELSSCTWAQLPSSARCVLEYFSKNGHPLGWTSFPLFTAISTSNGVQGYAGRTGKQQHAVIRGACPETWTEMCSLSVVSDLFEDLYLQLNSASLSLSPNAAIDMVRHDLLVPTQLTNFFVGKISLDWINTARDAPMCQEPYSGSYLPAIDQETEEVSEELSLASFVQQHDPSLSESRRRKLLALLSNAMSKGWKTPVDMEVYRYLWQVKDELVQYVPSAASLLYAVLHPMDVEHRLWVQASVRRASAILPLSSCLTLLDSSLSVFGSLQTYAVSRLYAYCSHEQPTTNSAATGSAKGESAQQEARNFLLEDSLLLLLIQLRGSTQPVGEGPLYRFLLYAATLYPHSVGAMTYWYLRAWIRHSNVGESVLFFLLADLQKVLPHDLFARLQHGWYLLQRCHGTHEEVQLNYRSSGAHHGSARPNSGTIHRLPSQQCAQLLRDKLRTEFNRDADQDLPLRHKSSKSSPKHQTPQKYQFCLPDHLAIDPSQLAGNVKDTSGTKATFHFTAVRDVSTGGHTSKEGSFTVWCMTPTRLVSPMVYIPNCKWALEVMSSHMLRVMNIVFNTKGLGGSLKCKHYDVFPLMPEVSINTADGHFVDSAVVASYIKGGVALNTLIVEAIHQNAMHQQQQQSLLSSMMRSKAADANNVSRIPDDLLINYFEANVKHRLQEDPILFLEEYRNSLASYLLSTFVLAMNGVNAMNTLVTVNGDFIVQGSQQVVGIDVNVLYDPQYVPPKVTAKTRRQPVFFLPCMVEAIGGVNSPSYKELVELVQVGLLALRQEAPLLLWALKSLAGFMRFNPDLIETAMNTMRETLMLDLSDEEAMNGVKDALHKGLNADYKLKVRS